MAVNYFSFDFPCVSRVHCIFHGRSPNPAGGALDGNISLNAASDARDALQARKELASDLKMAGMDGWCECQQVHGTDVLVNPPLTGIAEKPASEADGMMTDRPGTGLAIRTADCQPILITHKSGRWIMALHVGWRGNRARFPQKAVREFCTVYDLQPRDLLAVRGPSLGPGNAEFVNFENEWGPEWRRWFCPGSKTMNLWGLSRWQLEQAGLEPGNIYGIDICTLANSKYFFSWRADRTAGRQTSVIWIEK